jgi:hypothetical protein
VTSYSSAEDYTAIIPASVSVDGRGENGTSVARSCASDESHDHIRKYVIHVLAEDVNDIPA